MRWREKRTDVVEQAATAIYEALKRTIEEHQETVAAVRQRLLKGERDD